MRRLSCVVVAFAVMTSAGFALADPTVPLQRHQGPAAAVGRPRPAPIPPPAPLPAPTLAAAIRSVHHQARPEAALPLPIATAPVPLQWFHVGRSSNTGATIWFPQSVDINADGAGGAAIFNAGANPGVDIVFDVLQMGHAYLVDCAVHSMFYPDTASYEIIIHEVHSTQILNATQGHVLVAFVAQGSFDWVDIHVPTGHPWMFYGCDLYAAE
jgi:hypothetical protein